jgi:hypothetical protein
MLRWSSRRAKQSRAGLLELLRLDERWLTVNRLREVAARVQVRDLIELAESPDVEVGKNCALLLAALDPKKYLESALDAFTLGEEEDDLIGAGLAVVAGEACCEPFLQSCALLGEDTRFQLLADVFSRVGTLRARYYLERWFDRLKLIPPNNLLDMALSLGDRNLAIRSLRRLRDWGWGGGDPVGRECLLDRIRLLVELYGLPAEEGRSWRGAWKITARAPAKRRSGQETLGYRPMKLILSIGLEMTWRMIPRGGGEFPG